MKPSKLITIGVYGFTEEEFFKQIEDAGVDTFCDIRRRRGLRGSKYAFANSQHLQNRLNEMGIRYFHFVDLSPSQSLIKLQGEKDDEKGVPRRERNELSRDFVEGYQKEVLDPLSAKSFAESIGSDPGVVALFCVEGEHQACHRSLLAAYLAKALKVKVKHVEPE